MSSNGGIFKSRYFSAALMVVLAVVVIFGYQMLKPDNQEPTHTAKKLTTYVPMDPIDSSACITCHTSESVIGSVVMETDEGHGGSGG